jgi:hypothetical protein
VIAEFSPPNGQLNPVGTCLERRVQVARSLCWADHGTVASKPGVTVWGTNYRNVMPRTPVEKAGKFASSIAVGAPDAGSHHDAFALLSRSFGFAAMLQGHCSSCGV